MAEYTPTTDRVRADYAETYEGTDERRYARFDRWLNEIRAEAWTEGFDRGFYRGQILHGDYDACEAGIKNPYRPNEK